MKSRCGGRNNCDNNRDNNCGNDRDNNRGNNRGNYRGNNNCGHYDQFNNGESLNAQTLQRTRMVCADCYTETQMGHVRL